MADNPHPSSEALIRKIRALSVGRVAKVEDFVDFIGQRDSDVQRDRRLKRAALFASAPAFESVWTNPEDDVYDAL